MRPAFFCIDTLSFALHVLTDYVSRITHRHPQGVTMDMDSYQPTTEVRLPPRKRRPWWRWNLITLAIVLFVLLWSRELIGFDPSSAWVMAGTIFFLWAIVPVPWTPSLFSTMPDDSEEPRRGRIANRKRITTLCRLLAFFLAIASVCEGMMMLYGASASPRFGRGAIHMWPMVSLLFEPLFHFAFAAMLWLLAEALEKLDYVMNELRTQAEEQDKGVPE